MNAPNNTQDAMAAFSPATGSARSFDDKPMWVIGCIDSYGAILARSDDGRQPMHRAAESRGKRWRWNVWQQKYGATQNFDELSTDERFSVSDWLERHGYKQAPNDKLSHGGDNE